MNSLQLPSLNDVDQVPMVVEKNIVATTSSPKKRARDDADELDVGIFAKAPKFTTTVNDGMFFFFFVWNYMILICCVFYFSCVCVFIRRIPVYKLLSVSEQSQSGEGSC